MQQQQFQSQSIIMSGDQQDALLQNDQTQHVVYSPLKQNEQSQQTQYITQNDGMQSQYLIQSPSAQQPQQVFYLNSPPNRIQQQQQIALNHNMTQQNQPKVSTMNYLCLMSLTFFKSQLVLQSPKVVVQRNNSDLLQTATNMAQIVDHQNQSTVQYHFTPQMDHQNQTQQLIIQQPTQQIKQTIYPSQPNQVRKAKQSLP